MEQWKPQQNKLQLPEEPEHRDNVQALSIKFITLGFLSRYVRLEEGPIVNTYFFKPDASAVLSKIMSKADDLAMSVGAEKLLIQRVRDEISIAIPKRERDVIRFDRVLHWLATDETTRNASLPLLMGATTQGQYFSYDLASAPHLLIGGTTGSGKSVFINQLLCTLAVLKDPAQLRLVLVDTKQLDLTLMANLPHVEAMVDKILDLYPIMEDLKDEVRKRTNMMKGIARNIKEYNALGNNLPYYLVVIDELADVMGQDKELKKDEDKDNKRTRIGDSLQTLAQISRAVGIHIIAATQRPDVKIISGSIKTNIPTRICFKLPTGVDSRVILDENGAENLLGKGDYLYKTSEDSTLRRAHGSFVDLKDIAMILSQHENIRQTFQMMR